MTLALLIEILIAGGVLAWIFGSRMPLLARLISLAVIGVDFAWAVRFWIIHQNLIVLSSPNHWMKEQTWPWIRAWNINIHLGMDGLSFLLLTLTFFLGILSVLCSWTEIKDHVGFFHFNLLWTLAGITGVFLSLDLFLFIFFWEMMLIPMYLMISIWGHENRVYAAIKFFLFTQAGGLLMMLSILGLVYQHHATTGILTFDYPQLLGTVLPSGLGMLLMLGFFVGFAVKLPAFPFHPWLPDAHTEAPTAGSVILAGLLLKTGGYGLIRFVLPLFPAEASRFSGVAMLLGAIGVVYGAIMAFVQNDLKRLVAFSSVSHLGFVLIGVFSWNELALQGVVMQMICHGISTPALFIIVGALYERTHTRDMRRLGGLWKVVPRLSAIALFFAMAGLGLPGMGNFIGEFLTLLGSFQVNVPLTAVAVAGLVFATVYSLALVQRSFYGPNIGKWKLPDLNLRETFSMAVLLVVIVWLGVHPKPIFDTAGPALANMNHFVAGQAGFQGGYR